MIPVKDHKTSVWMSLFVMLVGNKQLFIKNYQSNKITQNYKPVLKEECLKCRK